MIWEHNYFSFSIIRNGITFGKKRLARLGIHLICVVSVSDEEIRLLNLFPQCTSTLSKITSCIHNIFIDRRTVFQRKLRGGND